MFCSPNRILWMVPIYSLDSVSMFHFISLTKDFFEDTNYTCRMLKVMKVFDTKNQIKKKSEKVHLFSMLIKKVKYDNREGRHLIFVKIYSC